jgi:hypothetical protein
MDKALQRHMLAIRECLSSIAESEQASHRDEIRATGFEIFERGTHGRASIDDIIHDCDTRPFQNVPKRVGNTVRRYTDWGEIRAEP